MPLELTDEFIASNIMGPNTVLLTEELTEDLELPEDSRVLDLGCGKGVSSLVLYKQVPSTIFAADLWITATENFERFRALGADDRIVPVHVDARDMPFAHGYFDALVSIDSYHYFGREEGVIDAVSACVKPGGEIRLAVPGMVREFGDAVPPELLLSWTTEDLESIRSIAWWNDLLGRSRTIDVVSIGEMACYERAWDDWLATGNEYAQHDRAAMEAGAKKHMNLIAIRAIKR